MLLVLEWVSADFRQTGERWTFHKTFQESFSKKVLKTFADSKKSANFANGYNKLNLYEYEQKELQVECTFVYFPL